MADILHTPLRYAYVLADLAGYTFEKKLSSGVSGGRATALDLLKDLRAWMSHLGIASPESSFVKALLFCDKKGLDASMLQTGLVQDAATLESFWYGFTSIMKGSIVDCGPGSYSVESALCSQFVEYLRSREAEIIVLGCCHNRGYIQNLAQYYHDPIAKRRVHLLRTDKLDPEFLMQGLRFVRLPNAFRSETSIPEEGPASPADNAGYTNDQANNQTVPVTASLSASSDKTKKPFATPLANTAPTIWLDKDGHRLDVHPFTVISWGLIEALLKITNLQSICIAHIFNVCNNAADCPRIHKDTW
ncbi:MAG: hypothetical protein Q9160_007803 [Pyrenula sp. 1 TL-2023]